MTKYKSNKPNEITTEALQKIPLKRTYNGNNGPNNGKREIKDISKRLKDNIDTWELLLVDKIDWSKCN